MKWNEEISFVRIVIESILYSQIISYLVYSDIYTSEGKTIDIVDSTAEHRCSECTIKTLKELKGEENE